MYRIAIEAFVLDEGVHSALNTAMGDISLFRSTMRIYEGGLQAACARYATERSPDLVVVQSDASRERLEAQLERLSEVMSAGTQVVVVGVIDSIEFYRGLMEMGVGSYMLSPITARDFLKSVNEIFGHGKDAERGRVIAVIGSKGGVGASTVAHNLASSIARLYGRPTSLVDMDIHFGTGGMDFNHETRSGIRDALVHWERLDEGMLERYFVKESDKLWLLVSNPALGDADVLTPESVQKVVDVVARMSSYVVVDVPHAWTGAVGEVLLSCEEMVVVSEADLVGLRNTQLLFDAVGPNRPQGTNMRCVLNNVGVDKATELGPKDFTDTLGAPPSAAIPWDPATFRLASCNGSMIHDLGGKAKLAAVFDNLATLVAGAKSQSAGPKGGAALPLPEGVKGLLSSLFKKKPEGGAA
jgi:pilus assembly protein CpaE